MANDYKFEGWMGLDKDCVDGKMVWQEFKPKPFEETDVDIQITHCGICGSVCLPGKHVFRKAKLICWCRISTPSAPDGARHHIRVLK